MVAPAAVEVREVEFGSGGGTCAADLYLPDGAGPHPAMVLATGFSMVKEVSADAGRAFAAAGHAALAIDYRTLGASGGAVRGQVFPLAMVDDVRDGLSYLESRPDVAADRIGLWGSSFGGGIVLFAAAVDRRARWVISQVPVVDGMRWMKALRTAEQYEDLLRALEEDRRRRFRGEAGGRIPVTGRGALGEVAAMPADEEIVTYMSRAETLLPSYAPTITLESVERIIEYSPESVIDRIGPRPLQVVAVTGRDAIHPIEDVLRAYDRAREPKQLVLLPYEQMGLYTEPGLGEALRHELDFLARHG